MFVQTVERPANDELLRAAARRYIYSVSLGPVVKRSLTVARCLARFCRCQGGEAPGKKSKLKTGCVIIARLCVYRVCLNHFSEELKGEETRKKERKEKEKKKLKEGMKMVEILCREVLIRCVLETIIES